MSYFRYLLFIITFLVLSLNAFGQHEHHQPPKKQATPAKSTPKPKAPAVKKPAKAPASSKKVTNQAQPESHPVPPTPPANLQPESQKPASHSGHEMAPDSSVHGSGMHHSGHGTTKPDSSQHAGHDMHQMPGQEMTHAFSRHLPMSRNGSGTSWNPDATPMYAYMFSKGNWNFMAHGGVFLRYTNQDIFEAGTRGDSKFDAPNWFMLMAQRKVSRKGLFNFNLMMSLDPITEESGYPLLFQSGETYQGKPLVDRQHPHDLFSELSVAYTHCFSEDIDLTGYLGFPGEPTIGPTAFMHRISSMNNPDAPLGHHWQDASHIQFGVATLGLRYKKVKVEGSNFTGREPDENRYNFDKPLFDSYSYRLQFAPTRNYVLQFSQGFLTSPEATAPGEDVTRTTASVLQSKTLSPEKHFTSALIWGYNKKADHAEHSVLLEGNYQCRKMAYYGRYEFIQKDSDELQITENHGTGDHAHHELFNVHALTLGTNRSIAQFWKLNLALGLQGTVYSPEKSLHEVYGKIPVSGQVYLRLVPDLMQHH